MSGISSFNNLGHSSTSEIKTQAVQDDWFSIDVFEADTTWREKALRVINNSLFVAPVIGLGSILTGNVGLITYASFTATILAVRKVVQTVLGYQAYPIASLFTRSTPIDRNIFEMLTDHDIAFRKLTLRKSGISYDAILLTRLNNPEKGIWKMSACGNGYSMEDVVNGLTEEDLPKISNLLLVNGPSVNNSKGFPTQYQCGAGFEAGLQFLEKKVHATHIILRGFSIGAACIGEAILQHDFSYGLKQGIKYLAISDRTFSVLSREAAKFAPMFISYMNMDKYISPEGSELLAKFLFTTTGCELDNIAAAKKLSQLKINHIIIQHSSPSGKGDDGVIFDECSLAEELQSQYPDLSNINYITGWNVTHAESVLPDEMRDRVDGLIESFKLI